jgi:sterol desaturase/sphingolipid hydroxylase (fatty acid hydroxylase superfamily)/uncharacterized protein (DUF2147 family)
MNSLELVKAFSQIVITDFLRYFIPTSISFIVFWILFKERFSHRFIQNRFPKKKIYWHEFKFSMSTILIFAIIGVGIVTAEKNGLLKMYYEVADYGWIYTSASLVIAIVFHDFYFYWTHRLMHHPKIYRHVHRVHHKSTNPSPWAAYSFHPFEAIVQALVLPILLFTLPMHYVIVFIFLIYMILRNVLGHLGFELFPKGFTKNKWLNWNTTSTHHNLHHEKFNCNYGLYFSWWDVLMKTEHKAYHENFEKVASRKRIKSCKISPFLILFISFGLAYSQSPLGKWTTFNETTGEAQSIISINHDSINNVWSGTVDSIILQPFQGSNPICTKCTGSYKDKHVIGMAILYGFHKEGNNWIGGTILDPASGNLYKSTISIENDNALEIKGFGGPFNLFSRTQKWIKNKGSKTIEGFWQTIDDTFNKVKSIVELKIENHELKGYIRQIFLLPNEGHYPVCVECKEQQKNKPIVGMTFMKNFQKKDNIWVNGEILDPGNGKTYVSKFWLLNENELKVRGYIGPFYRTQTWKRLK